MDRDGGCELWWSISQLTLQLEDDDETYPTFPEEMLNRFGHIMSGSFLIVTADDAESHTVLEAVAHQSSKLMHRSEWRARYCSLMAIASISEGSYEVRRAARVLLTFRSCKRRPAPF